MKKIIYSLLLTLTFTTNIVPLTVNSTLLANKNTGKRILLLGEMHTSYAKQTLSDTEKIVYNTIEQNQKKDFSKLAHTLLTLNQQKGAQTVVISETNLKDLGRHFEEELGLVETQDHDDETIHVMPRLFLKTLLAPAATVDEKNALFSSSVKPFNDTPAASFVFNNQMRWIVGDTWRKEKDNFLSFTVYKHWKNILESLKNKEEMPTELTELSIANVKEYIGLWHDEFVKKNIHDLYAKQITATIDKTLKTGNLSVSDHIATVHEYLRNHRKILASDALNNNFINFISLKTDLELQGYVKEFEKDPTLKYLIMNFGDIHTQHIKNMLRKGGYTITAHNGYTVCSEPTTEKDIKKQTLKALNALKKHPNLVRADKLFQS